MMYDVRVRFRIRIRIRIRTRIRIRIRIRVKEWVQVSGRIKVRATVSCRMSKMASLALRYRSSETFSEERSCCVFEWLFS